MSGTGSHAGRRPKRTNARASGKARSKAWADFYRTPKSIAWVLAHPELTAKRFTPYQWMILTIGWGQWSGYRPTEHVAMAMGENPDLVRQARKAAERLAYELRYEWRPALIRWHHQKACNGCGSTYLHLPLNKHERAVLKRHRSRVKKGRRDVPERLNPVPSTDPREVGGQAVTSGDRTSAYGGRSLWDKTTDDNQYAPPEDEEAESQADDTSPDELEDYGNADGYVHV